MTKLVCSNSESRSKVILHAIQTAWTSISSTSVCFTAKFMHRLYVGLVLPGIGSDVPTPTFLTTQHLFALITVCYAIVVAVVLTSAGTFLATVKVVNFLALNLHSVYGRRARAPVLWWVTFHYRAQRTRTHGRSVLSEYIMWEHTCFFFLFFSFNISSRTVDNNVGTLPNAQAADWTYKLIIISQTRTVLRAWIPYRITAYVSETDHDINAHQNGGRKRKQKLLTFYWSGNVGL